MAGLPALRALEAAWGKGTGTSAQGALGLLHLGRRAATEHVKPPPTLPPALPSDHPKPSACPANSATGVCLSQRTTKFSPSWSSISISFSMEPDNNLMLEVFFE